MVEGKKELKNRFVRARDDCMVLAFGRLYVTLYWSTRDRRSER